MANVKGDKLLIRKLIALGRDAENKVADIVKATAKSIEDDAVMNAPNIYKYAGGGQSSRNIQEIGQGMYSEQVSQFKWRVGQQNKMGAYAEFGTGAYVVVDNEWKDIAWSYYVNGRGLMLPQPYFYPAFVKGRKVFSQDLQDMIDKLTL